MRNRAGARGYNLVEVLISMAILGVVAVSIFTLFFMGRANVYSGKQMTQAVALGTQVLEDLAALSREQIYSGAFGIPNNDTGAAFSLPMISTPMSFTGSRVRSTSATIATPAQADIGTQNTPPGLLTKWAELMGTKLGNGSVTVVMTPAEDPTNNPAQFRTAQLLRVRAIVRWTESGRQREVVLDTVKPY